MFACTCGSLFTRDTVPLPSRKTLAKSIEGFPTVSVVVPTLNEAENLKLLLPQMPVWVNEIIVVDGHSTDSTIAVAKSLDHRVQVITEVRRGKGAALRAGFRTARGDVIVALDADCSMHPREMIVLITSLLAGSDFVKGSRFIQGGGTTDMSTFRMLGNWGLTQAVRLLFGGSFSDLCYGYFAFWTKYLSVIEPVCDGFEVETFLNITALRSGLKVAEVPSFESPRVHGVSNLRAIPDGWRVLKTIIRERFYPSGSSSETLNASYL